MVCSSAGVCNACTQGATCTSTNPCDATATIECSSGAPLCTDRTFKPAGASCGTNMVCSSAGVCNACTQGATCTSTNPCDATATIECSSGTPVCTDRTFKPDGTSCGTGLTCNAGTCVASRTVTGTRLVTYWPDAGAQPGVAAPDVAVAHVNAIVPAGGVSYAGTFTAGGSFSIPNVPTGNYVLQFVDANGMMTFVDTSASTIDLGYDALGRSGLVRSTDSTPVTFNLSGFTTWSAGDQIQITASNADVWDSLNTGAVVAGATTATMLEDWFASNAARSPLNLLAAADGLYVHQLHTGSFTIGTTPHSYQAATNATSPALTGIALTDKTAATITPTLAPAAQTGNITVNWSLSQFEPFLTKMNPLATTDPSAHSLVVGANAFSLTAAGPVAHATPCLFSLRVPRLTVDLNYATPLSYGHFTTSITPPWNEWRGVEFTGHVSYTAPGALTALDERVSVGRREPMSPAPPTPIVPTLGPVLSPTLTSTAGLANNAFSTLTGMGLTPSISWAAPATGVPTSYTVDIIRLYVPAATTVSAGVRVASWSTSNTGIALPPGVLTAGNTYYARITANLVSPDAFSTAPFRKVNVYAWASTLTGTFAP